MRARMPILILLVLSWATLAAQDAIPLDAESAATRAHEANERSLAAEVLVEAAQRRARSYLAFAKPQLGGSASTGLSDGVRNPAAAITGDQEDYRFSAEANQYLFGFGRVAAARDLGHATIDRAQADRTITRRDLAFAARLAVTDVLLARELVTIATARVTQRKEEREDSDQRRAAGLARTIDVLQGDIGVAEAQSQLIQAETGVQQAEEALGVLVALPRAALQVTGTLERPRDLAERLATTAAAIDGGADLQRLAASRRSAEAEMRAERAQHWPMLSAQAGAEERGHETDALEGGWSVSLRLDWTLYDGGGRYDRAAAAAAEARAATLEAADVRRRRQGDLMFLTIEAQELDQRIALKTGIIRIAEENYRAARDLYKAGVETLTRVNEANLQIFEARYDLAVLVRQEIVLVHRLRHLAE